MQAPTPTTDPSGLAGLSAAAVSTLLIALGYTADVAAQWVAVSVAFVNLGGFAWTRRHAWAPATVRQHVTRRVHTAEVNARADVIAEVKALAPKRRRPATPAKAAAKKT